MKQSFFKKSKPIHKLGLDRWTQEDWGQKVRALGRVTGLEQEYQDKSKRTLRVQKGQMVFQKYLIRTLLRWARKGWWSADEIERNTSALEGEMLAQSLMAALSIAESTSECFEIWTRELIWGWGRQVQSSRSDPITPLRTSWLDSFSSLDARSRFTTIRGLISYCKSTYGLSCNGKRVTAHHKSMTPRSVWDQRLRSLKQRSISGQQNGWWRLEIDSPPRLSPLWLRVGRVWDLRLLMTYRFGYWWDRRLTSIFEMLVEDIDTVAWWNQMNTYHIHVEIQVSSVCLSPKHWLSIRKR